MAEDQPATGSTPGRSAQGSTCSASAVARGGVRRGRIFPLQPQPDRRGGARGARQSPSIAVRASRWSRRRKGRPSGPSRCSATCAPNATAILYAKVSGYVKTRARSTAATGSRPGRSSPRSNRPRSSSSTPPRSTDLEHKRRNLARSQDLFAKGNTTQVAMLQFETDARVAEANVDGPGDHEGLPDHPRAVRRPGDRALRRSGRADHQRADQHRQRVADRDDLRRQPVAGLLPTSSSRTCRS